MQKFPFYPCKIVVHHYGKLDMSEIRKKARIIICWGK